MIDISDIFEVKIFAAELIKSRGVVRKQNPSFRLDWVNQTEELVLNKLQGFSGATNRTFDWTKQMFTADGVIDAAIVNLPVVNSGNFFIGNICSIRSAFSSLPGAGNFVRLRVNDYRLNYAVSVRSIVYEREFNPTQLNNVFNVDSPVVVGNLFSIALQVPEANEQMVFSITRMGWVVNIN